MGVVNVELVNKGINAGRGAGNGVVWVAANQGRFVDVSKEVVAGVFFVLSVIISFVVKSMMSSSTFTMELGGAIVLILFRIHTPCTLR